MGNPVTTGCAVERSPSSLTKSLRELYRKYAEGDPRSAPALYKSNLTDKELLLSLGHYKTLVGDLELQCGARVVNHAIALRLGIDTSRFSLWIDTSEDTVRRDGRSDQRGLPTEKYIQLQVRNNSSEAPFSTLSIPLDKLRSDHPNPDSVMIRASGIPVLTTRDIKELRGNSSPSINTVLAAVEQLNPHEREDKPVLGASPLVGGGFLIVQSHGVKEERTSSTKEIALMDSIKVIISRPGGAPVTVTRVLDPQLADKTTGTLAVELENIEPGKNIRLTFRQDDFFNKLRQSVGGVRSKAAKTRTQQDDFYLVKAELIEVLKIQPSGNILN